MMFWFYMLAMDLLIPVIMILFGLRFCRRAPKEINFIFGYRTEMSMKNRDTWEFAHKHCGKLWTRWGCIMAPLSAAAMLFVLGKDTDTVAYVGTAICFVQMVPLMLSIVFTEKALKKNFDKNGCRR